MKFLVLATFVALAAASTVYRGRNIAFNDDGSILMTSTVGRRLAISRPVGLIDFTLTGPNTYSRSFQIDDNAVSGAEGRRQGDILSEIFREYQGSVDEAQYERLLNQVSRAVKNGEISRRVYEILEQFDQQVEEAQENTAFAQAINGQQGQRYGQQYYGNNAYQYANVLAGNTWPWWYNQAYQTPSVYGGRFYNNMYNYARSNNVYPWLAAVLNNGQYKYVADLLANQQLNGEYSAFMGNNQEVYGNGPFNKYNVYRQLLAASQQVPYYGQRQSVAGYFSGVPQVAQRVDQYDRVAQQVDQYDRVAQQLVEAQVEQAVQELEQQQVQQAVEQQVAQRVYGQTRGYNRYYQQPLYRRYFARQPFGVESRYNRYYQQPLYRRYFARQPFGVESRYNNYFQNVQVPQAVY